MGVAEAERHPEGRMTTSRESQIQAGEQAGRMQRPRDSSGAGAEADTARQLWAGLGQTLNPGMETGRTFVVR